MAIIQRKDKNGKPYGNYRVSVYRGRDEKTGKKLYHLETVKGNINKARDRQKEIISEIHEGKFTKPSKQTLGDFLDKWLESYSKINMAPSTHRVFKQQVNNHVKPQLGHILLTSLTPARISEYYSNRLDAGLSAMTITHHRTMLHKAFETAKEWGLLKINPVEGSTSLTINKPEMQTYNPAEVGKFLEAAKSTPYYALFHLSLFTGLRRSELLALKWKDVNLDLLNPYVGVNRSLHEREGGGWYLKNPKTASGKRLVVLSPASAVVLQEHYDYCKGKLEAMNGKIKDDMFVFSHLENGEPYLPGFVTRTWVRIAKNAGLPHIRLHDARHTHATILIAQGVPLKIIQERLGHKEYSTTADIYGHVSPAMQQSAAKSFDQAIKPEYNKTEDIKEQAQN